MYFSAILPPQAINQIALGAMPMKSALEICGLDFAARQSHRLEDPFVLE